MMNASTVRTKRTPPSPPPKSNIRGSTPTAEFARRLQAKMQERGWNQSELSRQCAKHLPKPEPGQKQYLDISRDMINRYVRGLVLPRPPVLAALAKTLKCEETDLMPAGASRMHSAFEMRGVGQGRVALRINRTISMEAATRIVAILNEEDEE